MAAADARLELVGCDAVSSMLALLQALATHSAAAAHHHPHPQQPGATQEAGRPAQPHPHPAADGEGSCPALEAALWRLLLQPASLQALTFAADFPADAGELPDFDGSCPAAFLCQIGLRSEAAAALGVWKPWQPALLQAALLLAHVEVLGQRSQGGCRSWVRDGGTEGRRGGGGA
jgi:hypothetical protein